MYYIYKCGFQKIVSCFNFTKRYETKTSLSCFVFHYIIMCHAEIVSASPFAVNNLAVNLKAPRYITSKLTLAVRQASIDSRYNALSTVDTKEERYWIRIRLFGKKSSKQA